MPPATHPNEPASAAAPEVGAAAPTVAPTDAQAVVQTVALVGNPNVGKSTLFNALAGRRQKTANFPGTTQEAHLASVRAPRGQALLADLPGCYGLHLDTSESRICKGVLAGDPDGTMAIRGFATGRPDAVAIVVDATNVPRNLRLAGEVIALGLPTIVVVTMIDAAERRGITIDARKFEAALGCPVVFASGKTGKGVQDVMPALARATVAAGPLGPGDIDAWADAVYAKACTADVRTHDAVTDRLDLAFTHPVLGVAAFAAIMTGLFWAIFSLATIPMDAIEGFFGWLGGVVGSTLPEGAVADLLADGVLAGVGGTLVFLPQIVLLFFLIALLEQTGYLARAAFVIDRLLRPFGLPGHAFVPLLSGHACAIPAIMSARAIPDFRQRVATILAIPFMSCSARIPVYVLLTQVLFPASTARQALAFTGCYALGAGAGLLTAVVARRTILRGKSPPMALELPRYQWPGPIDAARVALHRGWLFIRKAGTVILAISIVLWWLSAYPQPPEGAGDPREAARVSFLGRIGDAVQPVFAPIGADRQLTIGILASFAAREVFVGTMAVQVAGTDDAEDAGVRERLMEAARDDGTRVFTPATSWAMLVFFVLAIQCLPTLVVTAREAGGWKWALLQFAWMTGVAYVAAAVVYGVVGAIG
ncbi:MAG: ferrous iron transporter B [Phycisphaeraceae bacterium]|nr:ferrous iron transporter B [Phycisphaeraceae bacterium]